VKLLIIPFREITILHTSEVKALCKSTAKARPSVVRCEWGNEREFQFRGNIPMEGLVVFDWGKMNNANHASADKMGKSCMPFIYALMSVGKARGEPWWFESTEVLLL
jgi:hypothetical protein